LGELLIKLPLEPQAVLAVAVGPVIVVNVGTVNVPCNNAIVLAVANAVESKLILPPPAAADSSNASRRLHDKSVPEPAAVCGVQLDAVPASSALTVTTKYSGWIVKVVEPLLLVWLVSPANV
jgi:hypothetical protein